nr:hypothetical protein [Tanacetum cinerariifolium]
SNGACLLLGKVEEGRGNVMEVVEWTGVEERRLALVSLLAIFSHQEVLISTTAKLKKIMETIHVKLDELTSMASKCNNLGPGFNCLHFQDSSEDSQSVSSKTDLDNFFGALYEYYATSTPEVLDNSTANTLDNEDTSLSSSIVIEEDEAPQIVSSSQELVNTESNTLVLNEHVDEQIQENVTELYGNNIMHCFEIPKFGEAESSLNYQDPSNIHEFH